MKYSLFLLIYCFFNYNSHAQIEGGNAYLISEFLEIAFHGEKGKEGCGIGADFHYRGTGGTDSCGIVADPLGSDWDSEEAQGDFFSPGTKENGFGIEIDGVNYHNNYGDYDIINTSPITHETSDGCAIVKWEGEVEGVTLKVTYCLREGDLFYKTNVTLVNETGSDLTDLYYYRNVDPDNNQHATGIYSTTNTVESQPDAACEKALVSATQLLPYPSYFGFGAIGPKFRVCHGGFSNRSGSDLWNAIGYDGVEGSVDEDADRAIALSYKTDLNAGDSVSFSYAVILSESALDEAFEQSYNVNYITESGEMAPVWEGCTDVVEDTIRICEGSSITLFVDGDFALDYDWIWTPDLGLSTAEGDTTIATPLDLTTYSVSADVSDCFSLITQTIVIDPIASTAEMVSDDITILLDETTTLEAAGGDEYTWFPTDGLSDPAAAITDATPTETITYSVIVYSDSSSCEDTLSVTVTVIDDTGVGENKMIGFSISPNPFSEFTTLKFDQELTSNHTLVIYDMLGKVVYRNSSIIGSSAKIEKGQLESGAYVLTLYGASQKEYMTTKLLVE